MWNYNKTHFGKIWKDIRNLWQTDLGLKKMKKEKKSHDTRYSCDLNSHVGELQNSQHLFEYQNYNISNQVFENKP